jgi:putative oxidoreductase
MNVRLAHHIARYLLGAYLIYMGAVKAMDPVTFLKLLREYHLLASPFPLNAVAACLPWLEICCGLFFMLNAAVRGTVLIVAGMFLFFSTAILLRALELQSALQISFCAVSFDCGCGAGVVNVCRKLTENAVWFVLALWLLFSRHSSRKTLP